MATIANLTVKSDGSFEGTLATLSVTAPIAILPNARKAKDSEPEHSSMQRIRDIYTTNTFGTIAMTQAVIPQMRARGTGMIVNVTSSATLASFPLAAAYTGSKTAIQGFTGSLAHELAPLGISVKLVEPGYGPTTAFSQNTDIKLEDVLPEPYGSYAAPILAAMVEPPMFTTEADVAEAVWAAVHDTTGRPHFPAGADALALAAA